MKKIILSLVLAGSMLGGARAQTAAPLSNVTVAGALDYESEYVFRGKKQTESALQPSVDLANPLGIGAMHVYLWSSQPLGRAGTTAGPNQTDEIDTGFYYIYPIKLISKGTNLDVGYQYYWYPDRGGLKRHDRSNEVHAGLQYDTSDSLGYNINPWFYVSHDFDLDSNTLEFRLMHSCDMSNVLTGLTLEQHASLGWTGANRSFGDQTNGRNWRNSYVYWLLSVDLDLRLNNWASAFVGVRYSGNNDGKTHGLGGLNPQGGSIAGQGGSDSNMWVGAGLRFGM